MIKKNRPIRKSMKKNKLRKCCIIFLKIYGKLNNYQVPDIFRQKTVNKILRRKKMNSNKYYKMIKNEFFFFFSSNTPCIYKLRSH